ncbi:MAG TPA: DUF2779 domain-containing protein [Woeseiaceae bacterium]|nr:DUF2779 domain-containing protein [Woeseiaceae bacterium]
MNRARPYLSKSRLISAWQCPKRLHLEKHNPELGETSSATEALFATGNQVGAIAQDLYGDDDSIEVPYEKGLSAALRQTSQLLASDFRHPLFEATLQHDGVLVRVDVFLPDGDNWRAIEIKASASVKDVHLIDCAIQYWVLRGEGVELSSISLGYINNQFVYQGDGNYDGLIIEDDVTERVLERLDDVPNLIAKARAALGDGVPDVAVGAHCSSPYECQFQSHCWPMDAEYPLTGLRGDKGKLGAWVAAGYRDIRDLGAVTDELGKNQARIYRVTCTGEAEVLDGAREAIAALAFPRYYLDFETIAPAVPIWAGTRPYAAAAVQWSCHIEDEDGGIRHEEFLDLSGEPPMRALAECLIACLGTAGPVLMYTSYEKTVIRGLADLFPDLAESLGAIISRLVDLYPIVKNHYYHPKMLGSWSIKAVLPALVPEMSYAGLEGINEGMSAANGYLEAINPGTDMLRKLELEEQLLRYCRFDTAAMVAIVASL